MPQTNSPAPGCAAGERIVHDKPIALRLTQTERDEAFQLAHKQSRSASNLALMAYRAGIQALKNQGAL